MGKTAVEIMKYGFIAPIALLGCAMEAGDDISTIETTRDEVKLGAFNSNLSNPRGAHRVQTVNGAAQGLTGAFFDPIGRDPNNLGGPFEVFSGHNGRACVDCHQTTAGMGISAAETQRVFDQTQGLDPVFRLFDGANGPLAPVATLDQRRSAYSLLRTKGLIRIPIDVPADRDFDIRIKLNPYPNIGANAVQNTVIPRGQATTLHFYRRPLLSANTRFISAVMWDGREATVNANAPLGTPAFASNAPVFINMLTQSSNATTGHAEGNPISAAQRDEIVRLQMNLVTAQETDSVAGSLSAAGATGGTAALRTQATGFGINDSHGNIFPPGAAFNPRAMTMFTAWATVTGSDAVANRRRSIARGQEIFNTKLIRISGVRGVNDALGVATLNGSCTTCHSHPNVGNHTDILPLDLGLIRESENGDNAHPVFTITEISTGRVEHVTDLGRAALTGRFADLGKFKGPTLRALASRAPYFHNGTAANLRAVIDFYDRRFHIGFTAQEQTDLENFLSAL